MSEILLGIDVGTTNVKTAAYQTDGTPLATAALPLETLHPQPGWSEYDADAMFAQTAATVRQVCEQINAADIAGVSISSMAETAVPIDGDGNALRPAIAWHDNRTHEQAAWWRDHVSDAEVYGICGLPILNIFGINKIMWLRENEPSLFEQIDTWLNVADYIAFRLCGAQVTNLSLASRMMVLDLKRRQWSDDLLAACDIDATILGDLVPSGTQVGRVHADAAAQTNLLSGTPVIAGGMDHPCGALALGIRQTGDVLDSMGTSESIFTAIDAPLLSAQMAHSGYQQGVHVDPNRYYCSGGLYTSGAAVEWIREMFGFASYDALVELAQSAPMGSGGVFFLPHLRLASPPHSDDQSRGTFIGLRASSQKADLARAVFEGLAYEARYSLNGMQQQLDFDIRRIRCVGGGTRNRPLVQIKAATYGHPLEISQVDEASTFGAAILAGVGSGVFASFDEASHSMQLTYTHVEPDTTMQPFYDQRYSKVYTSIYSTLAPLHHTIANLSQQRP